MVKDFGPSRDEIGRRPPPALHCSAEGRGSLVPEGTAVGARCGGSSILLILCLFSLRFSIQAISAISQDAGTRV